MKREFNNNLIEMNGPHVLTAELIRTKMFLVMAALLPQLVVSICVFGRGTLLLTAFCMLVCLVLEVLMNLILKRRPLTDDCTCLVTGMLVAFNLPVNTSYLIALIGCIVAIPVVKGISGRNRRNPVNPAAAGVVVMYFIANDFVGACQAPLIGSPDIPADAGNVMTGLQVLNGADGIMPTNWEQFLGMCPGAIGQVSAIALMIGGIFLIAKKLINWRIPVTILATMAVFSGIAGVNPIATLLSGGAVLGAVFMATDPVTSPIKVRGCVIYGILIGVITMVIRLYTPFQEGIFIGIVFMNFFSQYIDRFFILRDFRKNSREGSPEQ